MLVYKNGYDEAGTSNDSYSYYDSEEDIVYTIGDAYAYIIVILGVIIYTIIFAIKYLKREFTIIFLILLGPISCVTYPIDKISDGKSQAYNKWFSEFLYQVIIQPFHLLLYVVLVGSAGELAKTNVIYSIVCFAVMIPAEKFIKEMFGIKQNLGSPLGAFAGGALAQKAISALTNRGKNSGGNNQQEGENDSTPTNLPDREVDMNRLSDGTTDRSQIGNNNNSNNEGDNTSSNTEQANAIGDGEDEEDNPTSTELNEGSNPYPPLDEGEDSPTELNEGSNSYTPLGEGEDSPLNNPETEGENSPEQSRWQRMKDSKAGQTASKILSIRNQRVSNRWGSTDRKQRWKNRGKKAIRSLPGLAKTAAIGMVGAAGVAGALLTGNGKEALGIASGVTAYAGSRAIRGGKRAITGAVGAVRDYSRGASSYERKENLALKDFKADKSERNKAVKSYRERHGGVDPTRKQLDQEMEDRFALSRYGLSDEQIHRSLNDYQELREKLEEEYQDQNIPNALEQANADALNETAFKSKLANQYKGDFGKSRNMKDAVQVLTKSFADQGVPPAQAEANARRYLTEAAKMNKEDILLPPENTTVDIPISQEVPSLLGIQSANVTQAQAERVNNITLRLQNMGYDNKAIASVASSLKDDKLGVEQVIEKYAVNVEYLEDKNVQSQAKQILSSASNKDKFTDVEIRTEKLEMNNLRNMGVKEQQIAEVRKLELQQKSDITVQAARQMASSSKADKTKIEQKLKTDLKQAGFSEKTIQNEIKNGRILSEKYQIGGAQPSSGRQQPSSGRTQPNSGRQQPSGGRTQPNSGRHQPNSRRPQQPTE